MVKLEDLSSAVISGNEKKVVELTKLAVEEKLAPASIINDALIPGMTVVGKRFKNNEMFVPEVLMSARAMNSGMELIKPLLSGGEVISKGTMVIGTVKGDLHDIGKNLVAMMFESAGYKVIDKGVDVSPDDFAQAVKEHNAQVVGLSALLTTTMLAMRDTIEVLKEEGLRDKVKVVIGGAPISQDFADEIGADGFAPDAATATELVDALLK